MIREFISVPAGYVALVFFKLVIDMFVGSILYDEPASHCSMEVFIRFDLVSTPLCAIASGYLAAWIAGRRGLMIAALLAVLATAMSVSFFRDDRLPLWFDGAEVAQMCAGILAGGFLRWRQARKLVG
jgi:hypothetical protein